MLGGSLMVAVGIIYLIFEDKLLADFSGSTKPQSQPKKNQISRALIGVQVSVLNCYSSLLFLTRT
jgi:phosphatidylinositol glycan class N